jgi:beta-ribofuranosylaminobenzene 5'-phosphate synthase
LIDQREGSDLLEVTTGSRLHFGLLELAAGQPLRFGGLGLMLDEPGWVLRFSVDAATRDSGPVSEPVSADIGARIEQVRERLRQQTGRDPSVRIEVLRTLPMHAGLGAGTQLAAAVAAGLSISARLTTEPTLGQLIQFSGRWKRSGIGLYGFIHGGLILDEGHSPEELRSLHATSVTLNQDWRVVLITPGQTAAVTGGYEASLIESLGQTPNPKREHMHQLAKRLLDLANVDGGFVKFTEALQEYVDAAGQLFAAGQGGLYNGEAVSRAVELAKETGLRAVGQSSWGPTVFGFAENQTAAEQLARTLTELCPNERWQIRICTPARQGASWRWVEE